jgi:serine/threonine protein kinase
VGQAVPLDAKDIRQSGVSRAARETEYGMDAHFWTGKMLGKYEIGALLGEGGMAQVYKGRQTALKRDIAIKLIHTHLIDQQGFIERFQREAQLIAALRHPNIVQVYDFDTQDGIFYMVMEFIDGLTLSAKLGQLRAQNTLLSLSQVSDLLQSLSNALDYAHAQGMIHRDIKPGNVMFTSKGQPVLTDFGLAKIVGGTSQNTSSLVVGTPMYMSPEQAYGESGDARSDIYSLGVMLFELTTGVPPFQGNTPLSILIKQVNEPLPSPRKINPNLPEAVEQIIVKATAKKPDDRYQTCGELAEALRIVACPTEILTPAPGITAMQQAMQQTVVQHAPPTRKTVVLDGLRPIFMQILGPVGRIMEVERIVTAMHENPKAFPLDRLDELLERIATNYRVTDTDKKTQIRKSAHNLFDNEANQVFSKDEIASQRQFK